MASEDLDSLLAMGFERDRADLALKNTGNLQNAIDWLEEHQDQDLADIAASDGGDRVRKENTADAKSFVCNECGRKLRSIAEAEYHGAKSGHTDFAESTEEIAPLTDEEKQARLQELRAKLVTKRAGQTEQDKLDQKRNEEIRRKTTRETQDIKEDLAKKEKLKEAAKKKIERQEEAMAKQRIKERIAADKEERRRKAERERAERAGEPPMTAPSPVAEPARKVTDGTTTAHTESRLKLQTPQGVFVKRFPVSTTLEDVVAAIANDLGGFQTTSFTQNFPKKTFEGAALRATLEELSLVPSASLILK